MSYDMVEAAEDDQSLPITSRQNRTMLDVVVSTWPRVRRFIFKTDVFISQVLC
jgi:hypothetical protein